MHTEAFQRQAMLAWTRSQVQTRHVGLSLVEAAVVQKLARYLLFSELTLRVPAGTLAKTLGRQSLLWPMAISGDFRSSCCASGTWSTSRLSPRRSGCRNICALAAFWQIW